MTASSPMQTFRLAEDKKIPSHSWEGIFTFLRQNVYGFVGGFGATMKTDQGKPLVLNIMED